VIGWIVWRSWRSRWVAALFSLLGISLATATALVVPLLLGSLERGAANAVQVFDLLITAKGSATQSVLSSLYLLQPPAGNIPARVYQDLAADPRSRRTVPLAFGDNFRGLPLLGTTAQVFELRLTPAEPPHFRLVQGRAFATPFEAVLGARAARTLGLGLGDTFTSSHGFFADEAEFESAPDHHQPEPFTVVGVLAATGGAWDGAILVPIEAYWEAHAETEEHVAGEEDHQADQEVSAVLFTGNQLSDIYNVAREVNNQPDLQAVFPGQVFAENRGYLNQGTSAYAALSVLVLILAALLVGQGLYGRSLERRRTSALLRALGAGRGLVLGVVLLETVWEVLLGVLLGLGMAWGIAWLAAGVLGQSLGFFLPAPVLGWFMVLPVLLLIPVGILAALPPAWQASRQSPIDYL
jgi:putative ABC transport system permease protein